MPSSQPSGLTAEKVLEHAVRGTKLTLVLYAFSGRCSLSQIKDYLQAHGHDQESWSWEPKHWRPVLNGFYRQHLERTRAAKQLLVFLEPVYPDGRLGVVLPSNTQTCTPLSASEIEQAYLAQGHTIHIFVKG